MKAKQTTIQDELSQENQDTNDKESKSVSDEMTFQKACEMVFEKLKEIEEQKQKEISEISDRIYKRNEEILRCEEEMKSASVNGDIEKFTNLRESIDSNKAFIKSYGLRLAILSKGDYKKIDSRIAEELALSVKKTGQNEYDTIAKEWHKKYKELVSLAKQANDISMKFDNAIGCISAIDKKLDVINLSLFLNTDMQIVHFFAPLLYQELINLRFSLPSNILKGV